MRERLLRSGDATLLRSPSFCRLSTPATAGERERVRRRREATDDELEEEEELLERDEERRDEEEAVERRRDLVGDSIKEADFFLFLIFFCIHCQIFEEKF